MVPRAMSSTKVKSRLCVPSPKHDDRLPLGNPADEAEDAHVGPAGRSVDREVAGDRDVQAVQVVVAEGQRFGRLLRGRIGRERPVRVGVLAVGHLVVLAVEAGGGGQQELADARAAAHLQQVERAGAVGLVVDPGVADRGADAGPGGQVHHGREGRLAVGELKSGSSAARSVMSSWWKRKFFRGCNWANRHCFSRGS